MSLGNTTPSSPLGAIDPRLLWKRKWLVALTTVASIGLAFAYLSVAEPVYEVKSRLHLTKGVDPTEGRQIEGREDRYFIGTQAQLIQSSLILDSALAEAPITVDPESDKEPITVALETLKVTPVVNTHVLTISYRSENPDEATNFVNAVVRSYREHVKATEANTSSQILSLLDQRESILRKELRDLEQAYVAKRKDSPLVGQGQAQLDKNMALLDEIARTLTATRVRRVQLQNRLTAITKGQGAPAVEPTDAGVAGSDSHSPVTGSELPVGVEFVAVTAKDVSGGGEWETTIPLRDRDIAGAEDLALIESQLRTAEVNEERIIQQFGELHPESKRASAEVSKWRRLLETQADATIEALQHNLEIAEASERSLTEMYEREREKAKALDDYVEQERVAAADIRRTEDAYNAVFNRLTDMELLDEALAAGRASVVVTDLDGEDRKAEKLWPEPKILLAACGVLGLAFGVLLAYGIEAANAGTRSLALEGS